MMVFHTRVNEVLSQEMNNGSGVDYQTYSALLHVYEAGPRGIRMSDLARNVVVGKSGLTSVVDRLERRSLLERIPDPVDRRATRIILTVQGKKLFRSAAAVHVDGIHKSFSSKISSQEAKTVADVLDRVVAALDDEARGGN